MRDNQYDTRVTKLEMKNTELKGKSSQNAPNVAESKIKCIFYGIKENKKIVKDLDKQILDLSFCLQSRMFASRCVAFKAINDVQLVSYQFRDVLLEAEVNGNKERFSEIKDICAEYGVTLSSISQNYDIGSWKIEFDV